MGLKFLWNFLYLHHVIVRGLPSVNHHRHTSSQTVRHACI